MKAKLQVFLPLFICSVFFISYSILSIVKHNHYLSGYDFAVNDQAIWKYSNFKNPISTVIAYFDTPYYYDHFEPVYALISPVFWFTDDNRILFLIQALGIVLAGYAVYLLALRKKIIFPLAVSILITFLAFYGIQNAIR
jgi:uncharacterized membrane protein